MGIFTWLRRYVVEPFNQGRAREHARYLAAHPVKPAPVKHAGPDRRPRHHQSQRSQRTPRWMYWMLFALIRDSWYHRNH